MQARTMQVREDHADAPERPDDHEAEAPTPVAARHACLPAAAPVGQVPA
jgi:hypothetical protein